MPGVRSIQSFNDIERLKSRAQVISDTVSDENVVDALESSHRMLQSQLGDSVEEHFRKGGKEFEVTLKPVLAVKKVTINGVETNNYDKDLQAGVITLDEETNDKVKIRYTPTIFKDIELDLAVKNIMQWQRVQNPTGEQETELERIEKEINATMKRILNSVDRVFGTPSYYPRRQNNNGN